MTEPEQFWWGWKLVRIIVPILVIVLWVMLHFALQRRRREQRRERLKRAATTVMVQGDRPPTIAAGRQSPRSAADEPRNPRKRNRQKQAGNERSKSNAGRRPS
jgi:flagellar biosynthesis/type III secretory pathway M-ring protein FliF/YscJ